MKRSTCLHQMSLRHKTQGCHGQEKYLDKDILWPGSLERTWKVREKSGNLKINWLWQAIFRKFILFKRGKDVHSHEIV